MNKLKFRRHNDRNRWYADSDKHEYCIEKISKTYFEMWVDDYKLQYYADSFNHAKSALNNHAEINS